MRAWIAAGLVAAGAVFGGGLAAPPPVAPPSVILAPKAEPLRIAPPPEPELARPDPGTLIGVLPNGMRYAVKHREEHGRTSLTLYINAGALNEAPAERGVAHFLEHMAFTGSRHFPTGTLLPKFESAGIAAGRDQNAFTSDLATTYELDLPQTDPAKLQLGLDWLRDVADGLTLAPADAERERGVVISELIQRESLGADQSQAAATFYTPKLRSAGLTPGGRADQVAKLTPQGLRAFYQRWYRPQSAIVVIVGDPPVDQLQAMVEKAFSSWTNSTPPPPAPDPGKIDLDRPMEAKVFVDAHLNTALQLCRVKPMEPHRPEGLAVWRDRLSDEAWSFALQERLSHAAQASPPVIVNPAVLQTDDLYRAAGDACVRAGAIGDNWKGALGVVSAELRRFEAYGMTEAEFQRFKVHIFDRVNASVGNDALRTTRDLSDVILANMIGGDTFDTPQEDARMQLTALASVTSESVLTGFKTHWTQAGQPLLFVTSPVQADTASMQLAWRDMQALKAEAAPVEVATQPWPYTDFGKPGTVAKREVMQDPDFVRLTFANGLVVNFKQTDHERGRVSVVGRLGQGLHELPPTAQYEAAAAGALFTSGGLGKMTAEDIGRMCSIRGCSLALNGGPTAFVMGGGARGNELRLELQLFAAFLTDPGFRPDIDARLPLFASAFTRGFKLNPQQVASQARLEALTPAAAVPAESLIATYSTAGFSKLLKPALMSDALELTIVGDVQEEQVIGAVADTLGALPARAKVDRTRPDHLRTLFPQKALHIQAFHEGPKDQAALLMTWPLFVWTPADDHEGRVLTLLASILQSAAFDELREKLGKTYTPVANASMPDSGDQGALSLNVMTTPADVPAMRQAALDIARRMAGGGISSQDLERARKPLLQLYAQSRITNGWWMAALSGSSERPYLLEEARRWEPDMRSITLDEVKAAAKKWLSQEPTTAIALPAPKATAAAPGDHPG